MYSWRNYKDKVRRYFKFSPKEIRSLIYTIVVSAFVLSFTMWGTDHFDFGLGLFNLFNTVLIVTVIVLLQESVHRFFALLGGYRVEYKHFTIGLVIGVVAVFLSNGSLKFLAPGGIAISHLAIHRLGRFRYGPNYNTIGWIAMTGPLSNLFLALVFKAISVVAPNEALFLGAAQMCALFAVFNMLPFPPFNGHQLFFGSRYIYMFVAGAIIAAAAGMTFLGTFGTLLAALIFGVLVALLYFIFIDRKP